MLVTVTVRAGARKRAVEASPDGSLKIWTNVAPEKGKANKDVVDMLAEYMNVPKSRVLLVKGETSSKKIFKIMAH